VTYTRKRKKFLSRRKETTKVNNKALNEVENKKTSIIPKARVGKTRARLIKKNKTHIRDIRNKAETFCKQYRC
jgi:hypothetical protein